MGEGEAPRAGGVEAKPLPGLHWMGVVGAGEGRTTVGVEECDALPNCRGSSAPRATATAVGAAEEE